MSNVHAFINGKISKFMFPASVSNLLSMDLVLSLKIGTNDCKIFELNDGFISFRIGFQKEPALKKKKKNSTKKIQSLCFSHSHSNYNFLSILHRAFKIPHGLG